MLGIRSAPTSADAGIVKTDRNEVGVPFSVVLQPLCVGVAELEFWAFVNARKEESNVEACKKLVRAILLEDLD
jgi:hypothetical protein